MGSLSEGGGGGGVLGVVEDVWGVDVDVDEGDVLDVDALAAFTIGKGGADDLAVLLPGAIGSFREAKFPNVRAHGIPCRAHKVEVGGEPGCIVHKPNAEARCWDVGWYSQDPNTLRCGRNTGANGRERGPCEVCWFRVRVDVTGANDEHRACGRVFAIVAIENCLRLSGLLSAFAFAPTFHRANATLLPPHPVLVYPPFPTRFLPTFMPTPSAVLPVISILRGGAPLSGKH